METFDAITTRRAVRNWTDQDVPDEILQRILEAGRYAPSPLNSQPWHFTVIRDKGTIQQLMEYANHGSFLSAANVLVVVTVEKAAKVDDWLSEHAQHIYSGVCAMQNMWLAAWDAGIGVCWVTLDEANTRTILNIPDSHEILGSLAMGYPAKTPDAHEPEDRRPLADMLSYEEFSS